MPEEGYNGTFAIGEQLESAQKSIQAQTEIDEASRPYVLKAFESLNTDTYTIHDDDVQHGIDAYLGMHTVDLLVLVPHHKGFLDILTNNSIARSTAFHPRVPLLTLYDSTPVASPGKQAASNLDQIPFATYL